MVLLMKLKDVLGLVYEVCCRVDDQYLLYEVQCDSTGQPMEY